MFEDFFYMMRNKGLGVTPTGFLKMQQALSMGLIGSLDDLYCMARALMIKSERHFDLYDRIFAHYFLNTEFNEDMVRELDETIAMMLRDWLKDPEEMADFFGIDEETLSRMTPTELEEYFRQRLADQDERHDGGNRWIGTGGTSPVGHSGYHPGGMRVGGESRNSSAIKVALERRYRDYTRETLLGPSQINDAMKRLKNMRPEGPRDRLNIEETIYRTMKNAGEIEIAFDRRLRDKLKVALMIDNGGYSMDPYVNVVQILFNHARDQFRDLEIFYFHNTIYSTVWRDPSRNKKAVPTEDLLRLDPETRLIMVGDAAMAPYELFSRHGNIYYNAPQSFASFKRLELLAKTFKHSVWLNPRYSHTWMQTETITAIGELFPMFEITLAGIESAVEHLMGSY